LQYGIFQRKSVESILKEAPGGDRSSPGLSRKLTVFDLTSLGIAAIVGSGIFATIGSAAVTGGPAVALLFMFTAVTCGFSALCYAEFASVIPLSGSAYTYAYASFGEVFAWIIGWDLIIEYAIGNIAVAISWSDYFAGLMGGLGIHIPEYLCTDYVTAMRGYYDAASAIAHGMAFDQLSPALQKAWLAWTGSPVAGGIHLVANIPAFGIVALISTLVYIGIYETKVAGNLMVMLKVIVLILIIGVGAFYVNPKNWVPFAPNGLTGVLKGVSGVFFAYIGFDAISTTAEECRNTRRDLPRAIIYSLIITTLLYVLISLVLTGMISYKDLGVGDPLAYVFQRLHLTRFSGFIALTAIVAMASVILVFQVGQPRIWMSMSRDGLLPKAFSRIHPRFHTPSFSTVVAGLFVAIPSLFMNFTEVTDLTSIGTLFAFVLVSGGILILNPYGKRTYNDPPASHINPAPLSKPSDHQPLTTNHQPPTTNHQSTTGFRVPYINSRWSLPLIWASILLVFAFTGFNQLTGWTDNGFTKDHIPLFIFIVVSFGLTILAVVRRLSLIPVLGLLSSLFLMSNLGFTNWMRFLVWLAAGMLIYVLYSRKHSHLGKKTESS
jgi:amino acid transporter